MTYRDAVREGLREALLRDPSVFLMGEDIGRYGGCFAVTKGLLEEFGEARIRDTPLSESAFVGAGIGAALGGMRPIVEIMTVNFSLLALDQILNTAATCAHVRRPVPLPLVIRMATGAGRQVAAQHSHSLEGWYSHIPGLRIVTPATIDDAAGMLRRARLSRSGDHLRAHEPLQHAGRAHGRRGARRSTRAVVRRAGRDVSLITYGASLFKCLTAAEQLATQGIEAEVIDLRVLRPLDEQTVIESVQRTHRAVVVDEGWRSVGIAAEISARLMEQAFYDLDAPVQRVCSVEVPVPYARHMEDAALPQVAQIVAAVEAMLTHGQ